MRTARTGIWWRSSVHAQYTVLVDDRERVRGELAAAGIPTAVHYPVPIHRQAAYAHLAPDAYRAFIRRWRAALG